MEGRGKKVTKFFPGRKIKKKDKASLYKGKVVDPTSLTRKK